MREEMLRDIGTERRVPIGNADRYIAPMPEHPEPMILGNMCQNGVQSLAEYCNLCHHEAVLDVATWPDNVPVPAFRRRMVCTRCGIIGADVRPNWRERPERKTLTGAQWQ